MDKDNTNKFLVAIYPVSFLFLLCSSLNLLISISRRLSFAGAATAVSMHILFLLSICAVFSNVFTEYSLSFFDNKEKSRVSELLYGGKRYLPLRSLITIAIFIACYVILTYIMDWHETIGELVLLVPGFAIIFNAGRISSKRVRFINGKYQYFDGKLHTIISYYTDVRGRLVFINDDGKLYDTGVTADGTDFKALGDEFKQNGLKSGTKL